MDEDLPSGCFVVKGKLIVLLALPKKQPDNFQTTSKPNNSLDTTHCCAALKKCLGNALQEWNLLIPLTILIDLCIPCMQRSGVM